MITASEMEIELKLTFKNVMPSRIMNLPKTNEASLAARSPHKPPHIRQGVQFHQFFKNAYKRQNCPSRSIFRSHTLPDLQA
jgi:hypothetical protein